MSYNRRYSKRHRSNDNLGSVISDTAAIGNAFGPKGAAVTGLVGFVFFYFVMPSLLLGLENNSKSRMVGPLAGILGRVLDEIFYHRFIHPSECAGLAILISCATVACWKLCTDSELDRYQQRELSFIAKQIVRLLNQ